MLVVYCTGRAPAIPRGELPRCPTDATLPGMDELTERYVALWNESNGAARAEGVRALWAEDGRQVLQAPAEWREQAAALGFPAATLSVRGHRDLETRVTRAHEMFVAGGAHRLRARGTGVRVGDAVKLEWDMVDATDVVVGGGTDVLLLDAAERIVTDYQFIDP